jgi:hypothetical protein
MRPHHCPLTAPAASDNFGQRSIIEASQSSAMLSDRAVLPRRHYARGAVAAPSLPLTIGARDIQLRLIGSSGASTLLAPCCRPSRMQFLACLSTCAVNLDCVSSFKAEMAPTG